MQAQLLKAVAQRVIKKTMSLSQIYGIGEKYLKLLAKLNLHSCEDFLSYFPFRWEDRSKITPINQLKMGENATITAELTEIYEEKTSRRRMSIISAEFRDQTGEIPVIWFNQPFLKQSLRIGQTYYLSGKVEPTFPGMRLNSPEFENYKKNSIHIGRIVPFYSITRGITQKQMRFWASEAIKKSVNKTAEYLPYDLLKKEKFLDLKNALQQIHFPNSLENLNKAKNRLSFDELLMIQLQHQTARQKIQQLSALPVKFDLKLIKKFVQSLPFKLTNAQRKSAWQILKDLEKAVPMNRLLEGDVGSGKTIVAGMALLQTVKNKYDASLMAPTQILAEQHYKTLKKFFKGLNVKINLITANSPKKKRSKKYQPAIYVGTHALIQDKYKFKKLGLAVVDEQHRFGVKQREALRKKSGDPKTTPHLLSMSATPIPRTLALSVYGDLDLSVLDEMPRNRKKIITRVVSPLDRIKAYEFIKQKLKQKEQAFVIYPLVQDSDKMALKSATGEFQRLNEEIFKEFKVGLAHGQIKKQEQEKTIKDFRDRKIDLLIATAVVEVGVDIPHATMMIIEHADRFGLASLHQFRGRIGRRDKQAHCFLFTESQKEETLERLRKVAEIENGFELAKLDLKLRGPGALFSTEQSGFLNLKIADLFDYQTTRKAKFWAEKIVPIIDQFPVLKVKLAEVEKEWHLE